MKHAAPEIRFAGSKLDRARHVCAFFNSNEEEYDVLLPFIKEGFELGDRAVHVVNPGQRDDHLLRLTTAGIDAAAAERRGQFELRTNVETYLRDGHFDQNQMLQTFEQLAKGSANSPNGLSRIVCRMDWAAEDRSYIDDLIEFEIARQRCVVSTRRCGHLHISFVEIRRRHGDRYYADAPDGPDRRHSARKPILFAAAGVSA